MLANGINGAVGAGSHELIEPIETETSALAVGDSWRDKLNLAGVWLHVLLPEGGSRIGGKVGLGGHIRLVGSEEPLGTTVDGGLGVGVPDAGPHGVGTPESWDVWDAGVEALVVGLPVHGPADVAGAGEHVGQGGVVVVDTTLAAVAGSAAV